MMFIEVAAENTVYYFDKPFTYAVPAELEEAALPGVRVMIPFGAGNKARIAVVLSYSEEAPENTKYILSVLDKEPIFSEEMLRLVFWMKDRYFCTLFEAAKLMIPPGMGFHIRNSYILRGGFQDFDRDHYTDIAWRVISLLHASVKAVPFERIAKETGIDESCPDFIALIKKGIIIKVNTAATKVKDAVSKMLRPVSDYSGKLTPRQREVYQVLLDAGTVSEKELAYFTGASSSVINALVQKGAAERFEYEIYRRPEFYQKISSESKEILLSEEQEAVYKRLKREFDKEKGRCALLYGVTGSGKTSVFLKLIQHTFELGKSIIVMVPEISLTAQTIRLFTEIFGDSTAVLHSGLSLGERFDEWKRIKRGEAKIIVGTRSAVFAPVQELGLVVMDEEQEHTYKSESSPRFDAREVARWRCRQNEAFCLFSSATPSVETYYLAQKGQFFFHRLDTRFGEAELPEVELVDMNEAETTETGGLISKELSDALLENYCAQKQAIILLNRRGYHTFASCKACKEVVSCPHCSISMTYHSANNRLMCHYCGYSVRFASKCPACGSDEIIFRGSGTQRAEEEMERILPDARILRIDTDSVAAKFSLEKKLADFAHGDYDVMVGTQMVAKGLDFVNVTLVGVLSADQMLFSDDFRCSERTFDLLTQVVGRAGRGNHVGSAVIQTAVPENPYLYLASQQDYPGFYKREIQFRKAMLYPPFVDLLVIGFVGEHEVTVRESANFFLNSLRGLAKEEYRDLPMRVLRPSPAAIEKVNNKYRYKMIIKCKNTHPFREMISRLLICFAKNRDYRKVTAYADSNPYTIL